MMKYHVRDQSTTYSEKLSLKAPQSDSFIFLYNFESTHFNPRDSIMLGWNSLKKYKYCYWGHLPNHHLPA